MKRREGEEGSGDGILIKGKVGDGLFGRNEQRRFSELPFFVQLGVCFFLGIFFREEESMGFYQV